MTWASGQLPLFLQAEPVSVLDGSLQLTTFGSSTSGWFGGIDLYSSGTAVLTASLPFFLAAPHSAPCVRNLNLWVTGQNRAEHGWVELTLWNAQSGAQASVSLFVQGSGQADGALPDAASLNLFLRRKPAEAISLYVAGPGVAVTLGTTLFTAGRAAASGLVSLAVADVVGQAISSTTLYSHGW